MSRNEYNEMVAQILESMSKPRVRNIRTSVTVKVGF